VVYNCFRRWERRDIRGQLWERLHAEVCPITRHIFIAARGGLSSKIHVDFRDERLSIAVALTAGHGHENPIFEAVLAQVPAQPALTNAIMDKQYDSNPIRKQLLAQDLVPVIPPKSNWTI